MSKKDKKVQYQDTVKVPNGLILTKLDDSDLIANALHEAETIFLVNCHDQIALNKHFFLQNPFPLSSSREMGTPVFKIGDKMAEYLSILVTRMLEKLGLSELEIAEKMPR